MLAGRKKILSVVGARPNFMKVGPLHRVIRQFPEKFLHKVVHTGQHYDERMSKIFFEDLELPKPDFYLGVGSGSHSEQTAKVMIEFDHVVERERPDIVIVVGDVNSTVACSLVAVKKGIKVAHVEAGLRSFDRSMPEEINRIVTDAISELLFVSEPSGMTNLVREGISEKKAFFVGNVMIDSLVYFLPKSRQSGLRNSLGLDGRNYTVVTLHRPTNVDDPLRLAKIFDMFEHLSSSASIVFPIHPRTRKQIGEFGLMRRATAIPSLQLIDPAGYLDFLALMAGASLVVTDSGGVQEETTFLGIPCLTLRQSTERPITIEQGTNQLCGEDLGIALRRAQAILGGEKKIGRIPELWDGRAAERIVEILLKQV
ncbi:MAG: UDP-N-acetylglucosamine 2-epimerase (non-hydrolyzing) [Ignavibacteriales bacterium]|nr:UDP-N-acetylglucosamine 2-epimerase (non-hydrolyzing) [Ignavibacteriales bacterium]